MVFLGFIPVFFWFFSQISLQTVSDRYKPIEAEGLLVHAFHRSLKHHRCNLILLRGVDSPILHFNPNIFFTVARCLTATLGMYH